MRTTRGESHLGEIFAIGNSSAFGRPLRTFDPTAATYRGAIQNVCERRVNDSDDGFAFFDKADLHGEVAVRVDESVCAVEGIDQPHARLTQTPLSVDRFLGKNAVTWKLLLQGVDDQFVGDAIGLRDRLDVVGVS